MRRQTTEEWRRGAEELGGESKREGGEKEGRGDASTGGCLQNISQYEKRDQQLTMIVYGNMANSSSVKWRLQTFTRGQHFPYHTRKSPS